MRSSMTGGDFRRKCIRSGKQVRNLNNFVFSVIKKLNEQSMLKFFRKIRRKLLDEGNLKRYLIYAIGEILLVMVGILLALQVNKLNERSKNSLLKIEALKVVQDNFYEEKKRLNLVISRKKENITITQKVLSSDFDSLAIEVIYDVLTNCHKHLACNTGYKTMVQNNTINLIENKDLLNELIYFYEIFYTYLSDAGEYDASYAQTKMEPYLLKKIPSEKNRFDIKKHFDSRIK